MSRPFCSGRARTRTPGPAATEGLLDQLFLFRLVFLRFVGRFRRALAESEGEIVGFLVHRHQAVAPLGELAEQYLLGERLLDVLLNHAAERARTEQRIVALRREPAARVGV